MRWKTTLVLLLLTVGVGAYVSLYELKQPTSEEREQQARKLLSLKAEDVFGLRIQTAKGEVALSRKGGDWVVEPEGWRADPGVVAEILDRLPWLSAERTLKAEGAAALDPKAYGLEPAQATLTVQAAQPIVLRLGENTPVGHRRYIQVEGKPEIAVVSTTLFETLDQPPEAFRDTFFAPFRKEQPQQLELQTESAKIVLVHEASAWRLLEPLRDLADSESAAALVRKLGQLPIQQFIGAVPEGESLASLSLDPAPVRIVATFAGSDKPLTLGFGQPLASDATLRYARRDDDPKLYAIKNSDLEPIFPSAESLRSRACFSLDAETASNLSLAFDGNSLTLERADGAWKDAATQTSLNVEAVDALIKQLSDLKVARFIAEADPQALVQYGLEPEAGRIRAAGRDAQVQELAIGKPAQDGSGRYAKLVDRNWIVLLPESVDKLLKTQPADLAVQPTPAPAPESP